MSLIFAQDLIAGKLYQLSNPLEQCSLYITISTYPNIKYIGRLLPHEIFCVLSITDKGQHDRKIELVTADGRYGWIVVYRLKALTVCHEQK